MLPYCRGGRWGHDGLLVWGISAGEVLVPFLMHRCVCVCVCVYIISFFVYTAFDNLSGKNTTTAVGLSLQIHFCLPAQGGEGGVPVTILFCGKATEVSFGCMGWGRAELQ